MYDRTAVVFYDGAETDGQVWANTFRITATGTPNEYLVESVAIIDGNPEYHYNMISVYASDATVDKTSDCPEGSPANDAAFTAAASELRILVAGQSKVITFTKAE